MKTVTIAIPSLHRRDLTERCIEFIQKQTLPSEEWEIVVIENEAEAGNILPDPLPPNTRRIELPDNQGTTGSINRAVESTESRYILLLNNDVELEPDYLEKLVRSLDLNPRLGFAAGKLLRATQRTHLDGAGDAMLMGGGSYRLGHFDHDLGQFDTPSEIISGCGAAVLYRRTAFQLAGALDEDFFAYLDDLDLALRTQLVGYSGWYLPDAVAYHIGSATLGEVLHPRVIEYITRNQIWLLVKDYPRAVWKRIWWRIVVYQGAWLLFAMRRRGFVPYFRGISAALRNRRKMGQKHAKVMEIRQIGDEAFLELVRRSEQEVYNWHQSRPPKEQSSLLRLYFRVFGKP